MRPSNWPLGTPSSCPDARVVVRWGITIMDNQNSAPYHEPRQPRFSGLLVVLVVVFTAIAAFGLGVWAGGGTANEVAKPLTTSPSFTFAAAGDLDAKAEFQDTLNQIKANKADFTLALGDLSYGRVTERAWCKKVNDALGASYPFQLLAGNHDDKDSKMAIFAECLPNRLPGVVGDYGRQYAFDYADLARVIAVTPGVTVNSETYTYPKGSANYRWVEQQIDDARKAGRKWVIVATHKNCLTAGVKSCEIGTDLFNLLVKKRVDLIVQGHEHAYMRSKQLTTNTACPEIKPGGYKKACVKDAVDGAFAQGEGPVLVINGAGGVALRPLDEKHPDKPFFADRHADKLDPAYGPSIFTVTEANIEARFVDGKGRTKDSFTIRAQE